MLLPRPPILVRPSCVALCATLFDVFHHVLDPRVLSQAPPCDIIHHAFDSRVLSQVPPRDVASTGFPHHPPRFMPRFVRTGATLCCSENLLSRPWPPLEHQAAFRVAGGGVRDHNQQDEPGVHVGPGGGEQGGRRAAAAVRAQQVQAGKALTVCPRCNSVPAPLRLGVVLTVCPQCTSPPPRL